MRCTRAYNNNEIMMSSGNTRTLRLKVKQRKAQPRKEATWMIRSG